MRGAGRRTTLALAAGLIGAAPTLALAGETLTYRYDALGRLISSTSNGTVNDGLATTIGYDAAGNRKSYSVSAGGSGGPTVFDGSFESPPQNGGYAVDPSVPGVTFTGSAGIQANGSPWGFANAPDGSQTAFLQSNNGPVGSISFAVSNLTPGASYLARFYIAQRPNWSGAATITVSFNGVAVGSFAPASSAFAQVTTASFTAGAATGTLTFSVSGAAGDAAAIDAVSIVAANSATVADGSFETPALGGSGYVNRPTVNGLSFTGWSGITSNSSDWGYSAAPDGAQAAFMDMGADGVVTTVSTTVSGLTSGTSYQVSFQLARRPLYTPATVRVAINGAPLGDYTPVATTNAFTAFTTPAFTAGSAPATLTFTGVAQGDVAIDKLGVAAGAAAPAPPTIADGSFETPPLGGSGYVNRPTVNGLSFTGWSGITSNSSDWGYSAAPDGAQAAFMDMGSDGVVTTVTMTISGLTTGASYRLGFQLARRPLYTPATLRVAINGTTLGDYAPPATTNAFTTFTTPTFTAAGASATLTFTGIAQGDVAIDKVSVGP